MNFYCLEGLGNKIFEFLIDFEIKSQYLRIIDARRKMLEIFLNNSL